MKTFNRPVRIFTDGQDTGLQVDGLKHNVHTVTVDTNGTSAVNVFDANGAPCAITIRSIVSIALDTTAGNISLKQASNTVATIAKGTTAGVLVGATTLSNTVYAKGDACTVVSSSAGNSRVTITFTTT